MEDLQTLRDTLARVEGATTQEATAEVLAGLGKVFLAPVAGLDLLDRLVLVEGGPAYHEARRGLKMAVWNVCASNFHNPKAFWEAAEQWKADLASALRNIISCMGTLSL
jgi:hypothetical protein